MEIKQYDTRLMDLAYMIRQCREKTREVTRPYPDHVRRQADALESQMLNADMIIGGLIGMLNESRIALSQSVAAANSKEGV